MTATRTLTALPAAWLVRTLVLLALVNAAACAQIKSKWGSGSSHPAVPPQASINTVTPAVPEQSLASILDNDLQNGRYTEGRLALERYLQRHPGDHAAQSILKQLTADPVQMLGAPSRTHVVQPGESFSTLAARYLGDANLFVVLARYNNSTDPSRLRAGTTLRLPASANGAADLANAGAHAGTATGASGSAPASDNTNGNAGADGPSQSARAEQLQAQSLALLDHGQKDLALARLDQALVLDPTLPPTNAREKALRTELVNTFHQQAIVLYRDQQLDRAIALWDRVLAIDPTNEPAKIYRARALELKQRLQQY
ncbi:LysM peptidoglycan-binding domain-containing protein [Dyella jejuensis]|uniref:LysM peptidoglycan-binding domain-containing protein n=1 Tax=Dyella jejuensis TaxID=1432009 RepID=A0ABW8JCD1_9GAMM